MEKHLTWLPRALIKAARGEFKSHVRQMKGMELNLPQSLRGREKLPRQRTNYWTTSLHWLINSYPWATQTLWAQWPTAAKTKTEIFQRFTVQFPGFPSGFQGNHSDCAPAEHIPCAQASFNCCSPEGCTGRKRQLHFSGEQPQQQEIQARESHSWNNKENWKSFIACPRQVILNVFGGKPQDRNWLKSKLLV